MESENSQDISVSSGNPTAPSVPIGSVGSVLDGMVNNSQPLGDNNENNRNDLSAAAAVMQNVQGPPPGHMLPRMTNPAFGMPRKCDLIPLLVSK